MYGGQKKIVRVSPEFFRGASLEKFQHGRLLSRTTGDAS